jgi:hypothetical protein
VPLGLPSRRKSPSREKNSSAAALKTKDRAISQNVRRSVRSPHSSAPIPTQQDIPRPSPFTSCRDPGIPNHPNLPISHAPIGRFHNRPCSTVKNSATIFSPIRERAHDCAERMWSVTEGDCKRWLFRNLRGIIH